MSEREGQGRTEIGFVEGRFGLHRAYLLGEGDGPVVRMLRRADGTPVTVEGDDVADTHEPAFGRAARCVVEHRAVERIDAGAGDADRPETEGEDRVFAVAVVVDRRPVVRQDGEVRLSAERVVERAKAIRRIPGIPPRILQPARTDLRIGTAVDPALGLERRSEPTPLSKVAVVAEREPSGRVVERLRIGDLEGRQARRSTKVHEQCGGFLAADVPNTLGVITEGACRTVAT